ncbi:lachesin-like, partial [Aphis craccivora]
MTPGGSITFTCRIGLVDQSRQSIQWYHGDKLISIMDRRGSLSVETDRSSNFFASRLTLASVNKADSGKYTCKSGNMNSTTFTLHVISPANGLALQDGLTSKGSCNYQSDYVISIIIFNCIACSIFVIKLL